MTPQQIAAIATRGAQLAYDNYRTIYPNVAPNLLVSGFYHALEDALLGAPPLDAGEREAFCYWSQDDYGGDETWETTCGNVFVFDEGGPTENAFGFCGYCGKALVEQRTSVDQEACARRAEVSEKFTRKASQQPPAPREQEHKA